jgi:large subunit ribosomal protein L17
MRHLNEYRKLHRTTAHRLAMLNNLVTSLFDHERITTTVEKAKEARRTAERLITLAKNGTLHARRQAAQKIRDPKVLSKLFTDLGTRFKARNGGYTRIVRLGYRAGDCANLSVIELIGSENKFQPKLKKKEAQK